MFALDTRRASAARQLDAVIKRIIKLQQATSETTRTPVPKGMRHVQAKTVKTVAIKY